MDLYAGPRTCLYCRNFAPLLEFDTELTRDFRIAAFALFQPPLRRPRSGLLMQSLLPILAITAKHLEPFILTSMKDNAQHVHVPASNQRLECHSYQIRRCNRTLGGSRRLVCPQRTWFLTPNHSGLTWVFAWRTLVFRDTSC